MKKNNNNKIKLRNNIIIVLCITIIILVIGIIILSMKVNKNESIYNVGISKVNVNYSVKGGFSEPSSEYKIVKSNQAVKFNFMLYSIYDELSYRVTIENKGNIPAKIVDVIEKNTLTNNFVSIHHNDISDTILEPSESIDLNLKVSYVTQGMGKQDFDYDIYLITASLKEE